MKQSVVRLTRDCHDGGVAFGAGVIVSPTVILTARHVVSDSESTGHNSPRIRVQQLNQFQLTDADEVCPAIDPNVDLAVIRLHPPKGALVQNVAAVRQNGAGCINVGDEVLAFGFRAEDQDAEAERLEITAVHGAAGVFVARPAVPKGFSGGPVFADGALVGIVYARKFEDNRSFFFSGKAFSDLLMQANSGEIKWEDGPVSRLRAYPLGPAVNPAITYAELHPVIDAYTRLFAGDAAIRALAIANGERIKCGPDSGEKGIVESSALPDPFHSLPGFWNEAFRIAGLKSPRMLAALIRVADPDSLNDAQRLAATSFLARLERWHQSARG